jgi:hypothetical protein
MQIMGRTIRTSLTKEEFDDKVKKWHRLENQWLFLQWIKSSID